MTRTRAVAVAVLVASLAAVGLTLQGGPAGAQSSSWTQAATCPGSGLGLTLKAFNLHTRYHGTGSQRQWSVTGQVTVTAANHRSATYAERYRGQDTTPPDGGGTTVTGTSVQLTPGGGPYVVNGVAFLSPGGFLGQVWGTTASVCAALGG